MILKEKTEMTSTHVNEYIHHPLNQEITAIGGRYFVTKEVRLPVEEEEILYTVGHGVFDTTCCGTGGCSFAAVYGYVKEWKADKNDEGLLVTQVVPLEDESAREKIRALIFSREMVHQVNFISKPE